MVLNRIIQGVTIATMISLGLLYAEQPRATLLTKKEPFSRDRMERPVYTSQSYSLLDPARFSMTQSYSTTMGFGGGGSYSSGLYLNTIGYQISKPLFFSIDLGLHSPFHSSGKYQSEFNALEMENGPSLVIPRMSLEYKPSEKTSLSLHIINGKDAYKAYGPMGHYGWYSPFDR